MTQRLVQRGADEGPLVLLWLVGGHVDPALRAALPGCTILASDKVDAHPDLAASRAAAPWATGPLVLGGWSQGVSSVRALMLAGAEPDAVITIDGTHASWPAADWQIDIWRALALEARRRERLWVATATQQTYVEALRQPESDPFMATVHVLERALGQPLPSGAEVHEGALHVYSVPSARIDRGAHMFQLNTWLPQVLQEYVAPWIGGGRERPPDRDTKPADVIDRGAEIGGNTTGSLATTPIDGGAEIALRVLRRGMSGADVKLWQHLLVELGYALEVDGQFGPATQRATCDFQKARGLTVDGAVGPRTLAAAASHQAAVPAPLPADDWPVVAPYVPLSAAEREALFGRLRYTPAPTKNNPEAITILGDWTAQNIVSVEIPQLRGIEGAPASCKVSFHRAGAAALVRLWQAWEDEGALGDCRSIAGAWAPRLVRGSHVTLSNHATGTALDLNAPWNPRGQPGAAAGAPGDMRRLARVAMRLGWESGHWFDQRDDMHIQLGRRALGDPNMR